MWQIPVLVILFLGGITAALWFAPERGRGKDSSDKEGTST